MRAARIFLALLLPVGFAAMARGQTQTGPNAKGVPLHQLGVEAQKQYSGEGLGVTATRDGATIEAAFQRLEGRATEGGLWLASTADEDKGKDSRFRVRAVAVGRYSSSVIPHSDFFIPAAGIIRTTKDSAAWLRAGLIEEYTASMDGIRQDFVVLVPPPGEGELAVSLELTGVRAEPATSGAKLIVEGSGRELVYHRLRVTDATGRELKSKISVRDATHLEIRVDDRCAAYPVRIDPTFSDADWVSMGGFPGTYGTVYALASDDSGNLYAGGSFRIAGTTFANCVAKWNGSTWRSLSSGLLGSVYALAIGGGGKLYAGGDFTTTGDGFAYPSHVAMWDGFSWHTVGGTDFTVRALAIGQSGELYAGGDFTAAGGGSANKVAKLDGSGWRALGSGMNGSVYALAVSGNGDLYAGGSFTTAGGGSANSVAKWDGSAWSPLGSGTNGTVRALSFGPSGELYAGGVFTTADGAAANHMAKWDGGAWCALGSGTNGPVYALSLRGSGELRAAGDFTAAGGESAGNLAKWNGSAWSACSSGMNGAVYALSANTTGELYAGGSFTTAGGAGAGNVAKWDGSAWNSLGVGMNGAVKAVAVGASSAVYAGGSFTTVGGVSASHVARWDGNAWSAMGSGMDGEVVALAVGKSGELYAGGDFTTAGGVSASKVAKWDGSAWTALGSGMDESVFALAVGASGELYAGGNFHTAGGVNARYVAKWDGNAWSALGPGPDGSVFALALSDNGDVYAGGYLNKGAAKWDGTTWSTLGSGLNGAVYALAVGQSGELYAGGDFTTAGGVSASRVAKWGGNAWTALGSGTSSTVRALSLGTSGELYVGGNFVMAGSIPGNCVARWDGSAWSALGPGMYYGLWVFALALSDNGELYAGGDFATAGVKVSAYIARARFPSVPPTLSGPTYSGIAVTTATLGGEVMGDGGGEIIERGVVYAPTAISSDPVLPDPGLLETDVISVSTTGTLGAFTIPVTALAQGTAYSYKAYATNILGSGYSPVSTFTTLTASQGASAWVAGNRLTGADAELTATPFGDGVPNLLKYAFHLNGAGPDCHPMTAGGNSGLPAAGLLQNALVGRVFRFEYVRRTDSGLIYTPQLSRTLEAGSWTPVTAKPWGVTLDPPWERVFLDEPIEDADTILFGRVLVTAP